MSEDDAIAVLFHTLVNDLGTLARLRRGEGLDRREIDESFGALDVLQQSWLDQLSVPKRAVFALAHADSAFGELSEQYPELELWKIEIEFYERIEKALRPQEWAVAMSHIAEGSPAHFLVDVFLAIHPFLVDLRMAQGIDWSTVREIFEAFDSLTSEWHHHVRIPKAIALALMQARGSILASWGSYWSHPERQREINGLADKVGGYVLHCLGDASERTSYCQQLSLEL